MVGTFQEILDSSSGNSARIKSMTDLRVLSFAGSTEAKYSSTELSLGDFSFLLLFFFFISVLSDCLGVRVICSILLRQPPAAPFGQTSSYAREVESSRCAWAWASSALALASNVCTASAP